jgi:hypothetical protein
MGGFVADITFVGNVEPFSSPLTPAIKTFTLSFVRGRGSGWGSLRLSKYKVEAEWR